MGNADRRALSLEVRLELFDFELLRLEDSRASERSALFSGVCAAVPAPPFAARSDFEMASSTSNFLPAKTRRTSSVRFRLPSWRHNIAYYAALETVAMCGACVARFRGAAARTAGTRLPSGLCGFVEQCVIFFFVRAALTVAGRIAVRKFIGAANLEVFGHGGVGDSFVRRERPQFGFF